jgi:hypothetical protein
MYLKMKKSALTFVILISTFLAVKSQNTATTSPTQDNTSNAVITFDNLVHDYGSVYQGADGNCEFKFTNAGTDPLILSNVQTSCGCTIPSWPKEPVLPGKSAVIKVNYTKTNIVGIISKQITVYSNGKNGTIVLSIKGTVLETPIITSPEKPVNDEATPLAK